MKVFLVMRTVEYADGNGESVQAVCEARELAERLAAEGMAADRTEHWKIEEWELLTS